MNEDKVDELDNYIQKNYKDIKRSANTICKSYSTHLVDDIINDTYLKLRNKILRDGFKGTNYGGYIWISIKNEYGMDLRKKTRDKTININDINYDEVDYSVMIDKILLEQEEIMISSQQYDIELMDITKNMFEFIEILFDPQDVYLFKNYYLTPKSTYKKLSKRTGYSITECSLTIKEMKKTIRKDFISYYKTKNNGND